MQAWVRELRVWNIKFILQCVDDENWQRFRRSLKGLPTEVKLEVLANYVHAYEVENAYDDVQQCRVDNYINALKRGGQLTIDGRVQR